MATLISKTKACDVGLDRCDNSKLHNVRLIIDGKTSTQVLCVKHAAPFLRLREKMTPDGRPQRGRVYTTAEIAKKRVAKKA